MNVFISYRRADSADVAGRIADRLRGQPKIGDVFFDVDTIEAGDRFPDRIDEAIHACDAMVVLIGRDWVGPREGGRARIFDADDFVRQEVARALAARKCVLPVLIAGASPPAAVPDDLRALLSIHMMSMRHESFDRDVDELVRVILGEERPGPLARMQSRHPRLTLLARSALSTVVASMLLIAGAAVHQSLTGRSLDETLGPHVWLVIAGTLLSGAAWPFLRRALDARRSTAARAARRA